MCAAQGRDVQGQRVWDTELCVLCRVGDVQGQRVCSKSPDVKHPARD